MIRVLTIDTITILIVDDHAIVRQGLRLMLEAQPGYRVVGEAADGQAAIDAARELRPDVVLIDLLMPGLSAVEAIQALATTMPATKLLVLSSSVEETLIKQALRAGAHGYILKASRPAELLNAITQVMRGMSAFDPQVGQTLAHHLRVDDPLAALTARERDVFEAMARGMSNTEIAAQLVVSEGTVRTHVANVLDKLQLRDRTQVTIYALKRGLIRIEELR